MKRFFLPFLFILAIGAHGQDTARSAFTGTSLPVGQILPATAQCVAKPADPYFARFCPTPAPRPAGLLLRPGDRLAICGDSITEQRMYSRIIETYLTVCLPELDVTVRQYGWSGETAPGFLARMTDDCLRFHPTIATTCYGMNDHGYRAYQSDIGECYRDAYTAIVRAFKTAGARVVLGSPGCVGQIPPWVAKDLPATADDMNLSLCELRNIDVVIARQENVAFADIFWPMLTASFAARQLHGSDYTVAGKDGVHPDWAGHTVMAYAFLTALGVDGEIGTIIVDLQSDRTMVSSGHELLRSRKGEVQIRSHRYPFCAGEGDPAKDNSIRSGMTLMPFNQDLNRLLLVVQGGTAKNYRVTWEAGSRIYSAEQLEQGVNLAADFAVNPFSEAFARVDAAVAAKQEYETRQVKQMFHGEAGKADMEGTVARTEAERAPLAAAIRAAFVPVTHTIRIEAQ
ncbi:MAG: SGNH/GDSL hydrolase family protein [Opitutaceae bacterium]|nr:SGNH/GDSL hydrolase family protein [Opitutaceae bacterium]